MSRKVIEVCKLDIKDTKKDTILSERTGLLSNGSCDFCKNQLIQQNQCRVYYCGHSFHVLCHDDKYKCLTCYYQSQDSILSANIYGSHMRKTSSQYQHKKQYQSSIRQIIIQSQAEARYKRNRKNLKLYDYQQIKKDQQILKLNVPKDVV